MKTILADTPQSMGHYSAEQAALKLRAAITARGKAQLVVATGASQFQVLEHLIQQPDIDWSVVHGFHLDEYVGIAADHPASFCGYLKERFVSRVPLASFHYLDGTLDPERVIQHASAAISAITVDVALVGIGENGHLAFNDPPADFQTNDPYLVVELDEACRRQQVGEGWFAGLDDVPTQAISMSIRQIMKCESILCSVPDQRKSAAVHDTLFSPVGPEHPASILREHPDATLVIDDAAATQLPSEFKSNLERFS